MNLDIFNKQDPSGRMSKESFLSKNYKEEYDYIINYCKLNNIHDIPFKEKVFISINNLLSKPICKNPNCDKCVVFKNSTIGYLDYCSIQCISSDPSIKKIKEDKSMIKYGTKSPAQSIEIRDKIIKTNQLKYGGNSPMSSIITQNKSKDTLFNNWGVDNPNKSEELIKKRVESFKLNIEQYKESYKKTSIERYGFDHPWKNKDVHNKTIDSFYKNYKKRISDKIINMDLKFIGFNKESSTNLLFNCGKCGEDFDILTYQFYYRINNLNSICTKCFPISESSSIDQTELYNLIKENYNGDVQLDVRGVISPYEIDIYLPNLKIGFEFNGIFWHSDKFKDKDYHLKKYNKSVENGIKLYTIWEDDWTIKREICKSFILNKIQKSKRIMARKTKIIEVDYNTSRKFLDENHLQGDCKSSKRIGLYYNNELVSLMTFSKLRLPLGGSNVEGVYELTRFCNKINTSVSGGSSKLFKYFINKYNPIRVETYSDNLISNGDLYNTLGFKYIHTSNPGYWYVINCIREHRFNWRKQKLIKMGYDSNKTEEEIMLELGNYRIYNAGNKKWIYSNK